MFQFSIRSLLTVMLAVAILCTLFFVVSVDVRYLMVFVGVLAIPGPLVVLYRSGGGHQRAFALGALVAYSVWLVVAGVPGGIETADVFKSYSMLTIGGFHTLVPSYFVFSLLYAPWFSTLLGGCGALLVHRFCRPS